MSYTKYPGQIRHYHDLFEGDFFSQENQQLFSRVSPLLKKKIFAILTKEHSLCKNNSNLDRKLSLWNTLLPKSGSAIHPISYINHINQVDKKNLYTLLFNLLNHDGRGIYDPTIIGVKGAMIVGSSTYDDDYRKGLNQYSYTHDTQKRINMKGNDIDILFHIDELCLPVLDHQIRSISSHDTIVGYKRRLFVLKYIASLLQHHKIHYTLQTIEKKNGTIYTSMMDGDDEILYQYSRKDYHEPNLIVDFGEGRQFHICIDTYVGDHMRKKEYVEGRPYSPLFTDSESRLMCKEVLEQILSGKQINPPSTLEQRYAILQQNKRINYHKRISHSSSEISRSEKIGDIPF